MPETYATDISMVPVYMQGQEPSCAGCAGTSLWQILAQNGDELSFRFVYALAHKIMEADGLPRQQGTTGRSIMQVLQKYGVCSAALFPNDTTLSWEDFMDWTKIPPTAYVDALNRRIGAYAQVTDLSFDGIKQATANHKALMIGMRVGPQMWTAPDGTVSWNPNDLFPVRIPNPVVSGHMVDGYAFTLLAEDFLNSWSKAWGDNGTGYFDESYEPEIFEAWVASLPVPPVPVLPSKPTIPQEQTWLSALVIWLKNLLNLTSVSAK
ncbi:MAG: hypothetical protein KGI27_13010 [Thaumarchaeota archaeon]|nr:hypothetical protein [Nitrososphaerota archaeon]